jgi:hypothetical protein
MTPDAEKLRDLMSDLSEQAWFAGWMKDLEYDLWRAMVFGPKTYGRLEISSEQISKLRELSEACGGWIIFDDAAGETWLPLAEWRERYAAKSGENA